jgi:YHS domain-containing protein
MNTILNTLAASALLSLSALAGEPVNATGTSHVALTGYDPVAFFTDARPVHGSPSVKTEYQGATYFFANEAHQKLFAQNPAAYAPQFGGYCAFGASIGALLPVDVDTWLVKNGKLYLNLNPDIRKLFDADVDGTIAKAEKNWPGLAKALEVAPAAAATHDKVNVTGTSHVALSGYDPVAFFTDSKPVHGSPSVKAEYQGATYFFASEAHQKLFLQKPAAYAPRFGGYCTFGVSIDTLLPVDVSTWLVRDGKLYLNLSPDIRKLFDADIAGTIAKAEKNWGALSKQQGL